jgi:sensor histidine kinase YesM
LHVDWSNQYCMSFLTSPFIFFATIIVVSSISFYFGYLARNKEVRKLRRNADELEKEIIKSQREIIQLEDQLVKRITASIAGTPVIPIPSTRSVKRAVR